jgi:NitT/TauT family transport system substrate-binding protein
MAKLTLNVAVFVFLVGPLLGEPQYSQAQTKLIQSIPAKSFGWLPSYVAQEKGFFKAEGLEVIIPVIRSHVGMAALLSGEVHFANGSSVMTAAIQEAPVKAIVFYYDRLTWLFMAGPQVHSFTDLRGKNIAITSYGGGMDLTTRQMLKRNSLTDKDYTLVPLGDDAQRMLALVEGRVAGGLFNPDTAAIAQSRLKGIKRLAFAGDMARVPFSGLGARNQFLADNREAVKKFLRATLKALILVRDQPNQVAQIAEKVFSMDRKIALDAILNIKSSISSTDPGGFTEEAMRDWISTTAQAMKKNPSDIKIEDIADLTLLRQVQREMGIVCDGGYGCSK